MISIFTSFFPPQILMLNETDTIHFSLNFRLKGDEVLIWEELIFDVRNLNDGSLKHS